MIYSAVRRRLNLREQTLCTPRQVCAAPDLLELRRTRLPHALQKRFLPCM